MRVISTRLPGVLLLEPDVYTDERGYFFESFNQKVFCEVTGLEVTFVQDNQSHSIRNVLRGLHYQLKAPQGKLVRVVHGVVFDVVVDLRKSSEFFGQWLSFELSSINQRQLWIPPGLAHGFQVVGESADVFYKVTSHHAPQHERCIKWNDPYLGIPWPNPHDPLLSEKDRNASLLQDSELPEFLERS